MHAKVPKMKLIKDPNSNFSAFQANPASFLSNCNLKVVANIQKKCHVTGITGHS
jgi:hypothetical protein